MRRPCPRGWVLLLILLWGVLGACSFTPDVRVDERQIVLDNGVRRFGAGEACLSGAIPVLKLAGSPYEMGRQYGVLLRPELHRVGYAVLSFIDDVLISLPWYVRPLAPLAISSMLREARRRVPQRYLEEIRGMAAGSGLDEDTLLFLAAAGGLIEGSGCTSVLARLEDRLLHGRNFDWEPPLLGRFPVIVEYRPAGRKAFVSFSFVGFPGVIHGINAEGVSLSVNIAFGMHAKDNRGLPIMFRCREVLERAATLAEAGAVIREYDTDESGWMITVSSARENTGALFELYDHTYTQTPLEGDYLCVHNILFRPGRLESTALSRRYLGLGLGQAEWNLARVEASQRFFRERGVHGVEDMDAFLQGRGVHGYEDLVLTDNASINNEYTINTLIFDWQRDSVYYAVAQAYSASATLYRYDLKQGSLRVHREADPWCDDPLVKRRIAWYLNYKELSYRGDYAGILAQTDWHDELSPAQLGYLVQAWKRSGCALDADACLAGIERALTRYPHYGLLFKLAGDICLKDGRQLEAASWYARAQEAPFLGGVERLEVLEHLSRIYLDAGLRDKAADTMQAYLELVDSLRPCYSIEDRYERTYHEFNGLKGRPAACSAKQGQKPALGSP